MKRLVVILMVATLAAPGCRTQRVQLEQEEIAALQAQFGDLLAADREALVAEVEKLLGAETEAVRVKPDADGNGQPEVTAVLAPAAEEATAKAGEALIEHLEENPTPAGLIAGGVAAVFAAIAVFTRRKRLDKR